MPWLQLETILGQKSPQELEAALEELGAAAVWLRDAGDEPILEPAPGETPPWSLSIVTALFPEHTSAQTLTNALNKIISPSELRFEIIDDRDWQAEWQQELRPIQFGRRLWIVPDGMRLEEPGVQIILSPGMAFGTGEHPTTAMCLKWLDSLSLEGLAVLDYGCGSGLLAIAALALGADHARAVDIDPQALAATRSNASKNDCLDRLSISYPEEIGATRQYDVLVANILSGTLIELGPMIRKLLRPGALIALSGILIDQAEGVCAAWSDWADLQIEQQDANWVLLATKKHGIHG